MTRATLNTAKHFEKIIILIYGIIIYEYYIILVFIDER